MKMLIQLTKFAVDLTILVLLAHLFEVEDLPYRLLRHDSRIRNEW